MLEAPCHRPPTPDLQSPFSGHKLSKGTPDLWPKTSCPSNPGPWGLNRAYGSGSCPQGRDLGTGCLRLARRPGGSRWGLTTVPGMEPAGRWAWWRLPPCAGQTSCLALGSDPRRLQQAVTSVSEVTSPGVGTCPTHLHRKVSEQCGDKATGAQGRRPSARASGWLEENTSACAWVGWALPSRAFAPRQDGASSVTGSQTWSPAHSRCPLNVHASRWRLARLSES